MRRRSKMQKLKNSSEGERAIAEKKDLNRFSIRTLVGETERVFVLYARVTFTWMAVFAHP